MCTINFIPSITVEITGEAAPDAGVGDPIDWTAVITNTGPGPVSDIALDDNMPPESQFAWGQCTTSSGAVIDMTKPDGAARLAAVTLAPGDVIRCTGRSYITQSDMDQGFVTPDITVSADLPGGGTVTGEGMGDVKLTQHPSMSLTKTADKTTVAPGDVLTFTITVGNDGDTTLVDVTVTDTMPGLSPLQCTWPDEAGILLVGEQVVCTSTYTVTAADAEKKTIENQASATARTPGSETIFGPNGVVVEPGTTGTPTGLQVTVDIPVKPTDGTGGNGTGGNGTGGNGTGGNGSGGNGTGGNGSSNGQAPTNGNGAGGNGSAQTGGQPRDTQEAALLASMMFVALSAMAVSVVACRRRWRTTRE